MIQVIRKGGLESFLNQRNSCELTAYPSLIGWSMNYDSTNKVGFADESRSSSLTRVGCGS